MHTLTDRGMAPATLAELAADILRRHRGLIRELTLEAVTGGVVLRGRAYSFYGKQVALHEVRRRGRLSVVANVLAVDA